MFITISLLLDNPEPNLKLALTLSFLRPVANLWNPFLIAPPIAEKTSCWDQTWFPFLLNSANLLNKLCLFVSVTSILQILSFDTFLFGPLTDSRSKFTKPYPSHPDIVCFSIFCDFE